MENKSPSAENLGSSDGPETESHVKTASTLEETYIPEDTDSPDSGSFASDKITSDTQINKTSDSTDLVTSDPDGSKTSEAEDVKPSKVDVTEHGKASMTFGSNEKKTSELPELSGYSSNLAEDKEVIAEKRLLSVAEGKCFDEVPAPAVLQVPVPDKATASASETVDEAFGLQDVTLSDSEEVTLFERDLKSSLHGNPDSVSMEKQMAGQQSSQGEDNYLSYIDRLELLFLMCK